MEKRCIGRPDYDQKERELLVMVDLLQSDLMDIEVDLQKALKVLTDRFISEAG